MSNSARDLYVGIYIEDDATNALNRINRFIDNIGDTFQRFGGDVDNSVGGFRDVSGEVNRLNRNLNDSNAEINLLNRRINGSEREMNGLRDESRRLEGELRDARNEIETMEQRLNRAERETEELRNGMRRFGNETRQAGGFAKQLKSNIIGIASAIGAVKLVETGINMIKNSLDGAISRVDTLNGFPVVMDKMGFTAKEAQGSVDKLSDGIQGLPTTLDGIVGSTKNIALMTGDLGLATDTALSLNNAFISSGSGAADAERGMTQYVQMLSKGKVDMMSWSVLQETMGFALNKTAKEFGFTGKSAQRDLYTALQKGKITFDDFNAKIIELSDGTGGFAEIAKESSAGIGTSWGNMKTAVIRGTGGIIQSVQGVLKKTRLKSIENVVGFIGKTFSNTLGFIATGLDKIDTGKLNGHITNFIQFSKTVGETIKSLWTDSGKISTLWQMFGLSKEASDGIEVFANTLKTSLFVGAEIAVKAFEGLKVGIGWLIDHKDIVISAIAGVAAGFTALKIIGTVNTLLALYRGSAFASMLATQGFNAALRANPIGLVVTGIGLLVAAGVYLYQNWDAVKEKGLALWDSIGGLGGAISLILGPIGFLINAGIDLAKNWDNTKSVWENVWGGIQRSAATSVNAVIGLINEMIGVINKIPGINIPIVAKVDWGQAEAGPAQGMAGISNARPDGSHFTGLASVPFDNYSAILHKNESVLTAKQSNGLRRAGILSADNGGKPVINMERLSKGQEGASGGGFSTTQNVSNNEQSNINVSVPVSIQGTSNINDKVVKLIKERVPHVVRQVISDIIDEELQTT